MTDFRIACTKFLDKNKVEDIKDYHLIDIEGNNVIAPGNGPNAEQRIAFGQVNNKGSFLFDKAIHLPRI